MVLFVHTLFAMVLMLFVHCCIIHSAICLSHFFLLWGHPEIERKGVHFKNIVVANMNERTRSLVQAIFFGSMFGVSRSCNARTSDIETPLFFFPLFGIVNHLFLLCSEMLDKLYRKN